MIKDLRTNYQTSNTDSVLDGNIFEFLESGLIEYDNFIPQLRVPVPYIRQWNYNTMLKIDDKDFKASNPGVWCHRLHDLQDIEKFTDWTKYGLDKIVK